MTTTPSKEDQVAEAEVRQAQNKGSTADDASATDGAFGDAADQVSDAQPQDRHGDQQQEQREVQRAPNLRQSARDAIISSFREQREEEANDDQGDLTSAADLLPPELAPRRVQQQDDQSDQGAKDPDVEPEQVPADPPPAKVKLKVRGQEIEYTHEEVLALARKAAAGDDYLDEARNKLDEVNDLLRTTKSKAGAEPAAQPQGDEAAQTGADGNQDGDEPHVDPFREVVEQIQYGDPSEVGAKLASAIDQAAGKKADEAAKKALQAERIRDEKTRADALMKDFADKNPDIAGDDIARAALERILIQKQVEDLLSLGVTRDQIPNDPKAVANWHRDLRVNGYKVKAADVLLKEGHEAFLAWRQPAAPAPKEPAAPKVPARVDVVVDRTERRAAIPTQPTHAAVPVRREQLVAPAEPNRSAIVQRIAQSRAKMRGAAI